MRKTIHKVFMAWNFEKEEKWLNEMSAKGLQLVGVGFCRYVFEDGLPGEYFYRLELLENVPGNIESTQYIRFVEETGAQMVGSLMRWVYFRRKASEGEFDLFSDIDSRLRFLKRVLSLMAAVSALNLFNGLNLGVLQNIGNFEYWKLAAGMLCFLIGALGTKGSIKIYLQMRRLRKEKLLHE